MDLDVVAADAALGVLRVFQRHDRRPAALTVCSHSRTRPRTRARPPVLAALAAIAAALAWVGAPATTATDRAPSTTAIAAATADAAATFVGLLDLAPGRDLAAVVRFDAAAELVQPLSSDRAALLAAIDAGLRLARGELESARDGRADLLVAVLLTDGLQTGAAGAEIDEARRARAAGIRVYAIGLGADADPTALVDMAGDPARYYHAPDARSLEAIYRDVARDIACGAGSR